MPDFFKGFERKKIISNGVANNLVRGGTGDHVLLLRAGQRRTVMKS
jgi:hypothetical protein